MKKKIINFFIKITLFFSFAFFLFVPKNIFYIVADFDDDYLKVYTKFNLYPKKLDEIIAKQNKLLSKKDNKKDNKNNIIFFSKKDKVKKIDKNKFLEFYNKSKEIHKYLVYVWFAFLFYLFLGMNRISKKYNL